MSKTTTKPTRLTKKIKADDITQVGRRVAWNRYLDHYPMDHKLLNGIKPKDTGVEVQGIILDLCDPIVWENSSVFRGQECTRETVMAHVKDCQARGLLTDLVAVQFDTGKICLAPASELVPAEHGLPAARPARPVRPARTTKRTSKQVQQVDPDPYDAEVWAAVEL